MTAAHMHTAAGTCVASSSMSRNVFCCCCMHGEQSLVPKAAMNAAYLEEGKVNMSLLHTKEELVQAITACLDAIDVSTSHASCTVYQRAVDAVIVYFCLGMLIACRQRSHSTACFSQCTRLFRTCISLYVMHDAAVLASTPSYQLCARHMTHRLLPPTLAGQQAD